MTLDQEAERYSQISKETADTVLGFQRSRKKPWISDATLELTDQRREMKKVIASRSDLKPTYNAFTRQIRASIAMDYEQWCNTNCDQLEHYQNTHQTRALHQKIKELTNGVVIKKRETLQLKTRMGCF